MEDYYNTTSKKIIDFIIGFFGVWIVNLILGYLFTILFILKFLIITSYSLQFILTVVAIIIAFKINRKYIGIGIISALLIPLLLFGACVGIFTALGGF